MSSEPMPLSGRLARDSLWMAMSRGLQVIGAIVIVSLASRVLGGEGYAVFASVQIFSALGALVFLGIPQAMVREAAAAFAVGDTERLRRVQGSGQAVLLVVSAAGALLLVLLAPWLVHFAEVTETPTRDLVVAVRIAGAVLFLVGAGAGPEAMLQARRQFGALAKVNSASTLVGWAVLIAVLVGGGDLRAVLWSTLVGPALGLVARVWALSALRQPVLALSAVDGPTSRKLLRFGLPLFVNEATFLVHTQVDAFLVLLWLPARFVGYYHASVRIAVSTLIPPRLLAVPFFPAVAELTEQRDFARIEEGLRRVTAYLSILVVPITVGGCYLAQPLLALLFPPEFGVADTALQILLVGYAANALTYPYTGCLLGLGRPGAITLVNVPGTVVTLVLHVLLIPLLGIDGAALGASLPAVAALCAYPPMVAAALRREGHSRSALALVPWRRLGKTLVAAGVMVVALALIPTPAGNAGVLVSIGVGAVVYVVVFLVALRGLSDADRRLLRNTFRRRAA